MTAGVNLDDVSRTWRHVLTLDALPVLMNEQGEEATFAVRPDTAAAPDGLLPVFLSAGEAVWRELTGKGFELDVRRDPKALLGYRIEAIAGGSFPLVMLAMLEAKERVRESDGVRVNALNALWSDATARLEALDNDRSRSP